MTCRGGVAFAQYHCRIRVFVKTQFNRSLSLQVQVRFTSDSHVGPGTHLGAVRSAVKKPDAVHRGGDVPVVNTVNLNSVPKNMLRLPPANQLDAPEQQFALIVSPPDKRELRIPKRIEQRKKNR